MNKVVVAGGGVLGTQIGLMCAYTGHDVTFWLRSQSSIGRTQPKIELYKKAMLDDLAAAKNLIGNPLGKLLYPKGLITNWDGITAEAIDELITKGEMSLDGLNQITEKISEVKNDEFLNQNLKIRGFLLTRYNQNLRIAKDVYNALQTKFPSQIFNTKIRENTKVSEAPGYRCTIFEHDPSCAGAEDYLQLAREIGGIKPGSKWK